MQLTRRQIVDYLRAHRTATAAELSQSLQVTQANIRHHLGLLLESGVITEVGQETGRGQGRPRKIYTLTEKALVQNLGGLSHALLQSMIACSENIDQALFDIADELIGDYALADNMHVRLKETIERLNALGYQANWEASPSGPRVIMQNCPYIAIISENPDLCKMDAAVIELLLGQPMRQTTKLERALGGAPHCAFVPANPGK